MGIPELGASTVHQKVNNCDKTIRKGEKELKVYWQKNNKIKKAKTLKTSKFGFVHMPEQKLHVKLSCQIAFILQNGIFEQIGANLALVRAEEVQNALKMCFDKMLEVSNWF